MSPKNAMNERQGLAGQVRFLRASNLFLILLCLALVSLVGYILATEKTHILPPEVKRPYEIGSNYANKDYLVDMASYVMGMVLTRSPETADYNNRVILKMAHPDGYGELKTSLDAAAIRQKQEKVTTIWVPRNEKVSEQALSVEANGQVKTYIGDKLTSQREKTYLVQFSITTSGRLYVLKMDEIVKRDSTGKPLTQP